MQQEQDIRAVALLRAKPGEEAAVQQALLACAGPSRAEEGNRSYVVHTCPEQPGLFTVVEHWANRAVRDRHTQTPHFRALGEAVDETHKLSEHVFLCTNAPRLAVGATDRAP